MAIIEDENGNSILDENDSAITDEAGGDITYPANAQSLSLSIQSGTYLVGIVIAAASQSLSLAAQSPAAINFDMKFGVNAQSLAMTPQSPTTLYDKLVQLNSIALSLSQKQAYALTEGDVSIQAALQHLYLTPKWLIWPAEEEISAWLQEQLAKINYKPQLRVYVGSSNYNDRIVKYPVIRQSSEKLKSVKIDLPLANDDGGMNFFYDQTYMLVNSVSIELGDTHPTSGWEGLPIFTGFVYGSKYSSNRCIIDARDRLWDFTQLKVGDTDSIVEIPASGGVTPSEIAWTLCTCYGGLDTTKDIANPDIDWMDFQYWAQQFSTNNILTHGRYSGEKIIEALEDLVKYTSSAVNIGGDGKLHFVRYEEVNSLDYTWTENETIKLSVDVNKRRLVNKQWVYWDYDPGSDYFAGKVSHEDSLSVNTFGLYEEIEQRETIWYVDTPSALNIAQRRIALYSTPPKYFILETGLDGVWRAMGETARLNSDFYNVTSAAGWRIVARDLHLNEGRVINYLDEATVLNAFYLDVSTLDGDHRLL
jgi:hypothetical protein